MIPKKSNKFLDRYDIYYEMPYFWGISYFQHDFKGYVKIDNGLSRFNPFYKSGLLKIDPSNMHYSFNGITQELYEQYTN